MPSIKKHLTKYRLNSFKKFKKTLFFCGLLTAIDADKSHEIFPLK
jgi:hypothetical protein